jgi:hypothetical protein
VDPASAPSLRMVGNRSLAMMRGFASATTTTTASAGPTSHPNARFEVLSVPSWTRGHGSRGSVGERIQVIPGFKTSAGEFGQFLGTTYPIYVTRISPAKVFLLEYFILKSKFLLWFSYQCTHLRARGVFKSQYTVRSLLVL